MKRHILKAARKRLGMTQGEMARKLYISRQHYSLLESGLRTGAADLWDRLEDITGIDQRRLRTIDVPEHMEDEGNETGRIPARADTAISDSACKQTEPGEPT